MTRTFAVQPRSTLTSNQKSIGLHGGTEPAFSKGNFNDEKRSGSYACVGCDARVFLSEHKFDSGTGWPSFFRPASPDAIGTSRDFKLIVPRTEVHCARCGLHLGHVFRDGPKPTGLRYCINGTVLAFLPG